MVRQVRANLRYTGVQGTPVHAGELCIIICITIIIKCVLDDSYVHNQSWERRQSRDQVIKLAGSSTYVWLIGCSKLYRMSADRLFQTDGCYSKHTPCRVRTDSGFV